VQPSNDSSLPFEVTKGSLSDFTGKSDTVYYFPTRAAAEAFAAQQEKNLPPSEYFKWTYTVSENAKAVENAARRVWTPNAGKAAQNLAKDKDLAKALDEAAKGSKYFSAADLRAIASIESSANRNTGANRFGYVGLFQMGSAAAKEAGYKYSDLKDWQKNVAAGVRYLDINAGRLSKAGVSVTPLNVYLAHQQGAAGAVRILKAVENGTADETAANRNQLANLPRSVVKSINGTGREVTVQDYYDYWKAAFQTVHDGVSPPQPQPPPQFQPLPLLFLPW
jgi:hypothetical protein